MDFQQIRKYVKGVLTNSFLNKTTLDKLSTSDAGNLLFDGKEIKGDGDLSIIAEDWNDKISYDIGDYVLYNNKLYKKIAETTESLNYDNIIPGYYFTTKDQRLMLAGNYWADKWVSKPSYGGWVQNTNTGQNYPILISNISMDATDINAEGYVLNEQYTITIAGETWYVGYPNTNHRCNTSNVSGLQLQVPYDADITQQAKNILIAANILIISPEPDLSSAWEEVIIMNEIKQSKQHNYSEDEQIVGKWIDGKPLYRKVITTQMPQVTTSNSPVTKTIEHNIVNAMFKKIELYSIDDLGNCMAQSYTNVGDYFFAWVDSSVNLYIRSNRQDFNNRTAIIILEYTKTTD